MEVILLEKIAKLGNLGDKVTIKPGFGRNYLIPQGKAVAATAHKIAEFEARRAELEKIAAEKLQAAEARAEALQKLDIVIPHKAGDEGRLFGSVGTHTIADAMTAAGVAVEKHEVRLPNGALRHLGDFDIDVAVHSDVMVKVAVHIVNEA